MVLEKINGQNSRSYHRYNQSKNKTIYLFNNYYVHNISCIIDHNNIYFNKNSIDKFIICQYKSI